MEGGFPGVKFVEISLQANRFENEDHHQASMIKWFETEPSDVCRLRAHAGALRSRLQIQVSASDESTSEYGFTETAKCKQQTQTA